MNWASEENGVIFETNLVDKSPAVRSNLHGLLLAIAAVMFCVARPLANQFAPYSPLNAFSGFFSLLFIFCTGAIGWRARSFSMPRLLPCVVLAWLALFVAGAWRAPYMGAAVPLCGDAALYILLLAAGFIAGRLDPALGGIVVRATIALAAIEAFAAIWQIHVDLPRLRAQIESGELPLIDSLKGKIGLDRLYGDNAFGTFGNPNSLAGFLLLGFLLLLGHAAAARKYFSLISIVIAGLILWALFWTGSKGGDVALLGGLWFFILQRLNEKQRRPLINWLTLLGVASLSLLLALGYHEIIPSRYFGLSMQVRFEYWRAALAMFVKHPLAGVGLCGYGEWYSILKSPQGWESKDPHNEFVCMLAELGVFAPMLYAALWWLMLKPRAAISVDSLTVNDSEFFKDKRGDWCVIACGSLCLLLAILNFEVFNSSDLFNVLSGNNTSRQALASSVQTLSLPLIFAAAMYFLRPIPPRSTSNAVENNGALEHGFRAAAGAVLLHQLVDFDFKSQAIMCPLFLLGGAFLAAKTADAPVGAQGKSRSPESKLFCCALIAGALLLLPTAVYIPLASGLAREQADAAEMQLKLLNAHPEKATESENEASLRAEIIQARLRAMQMSPFDAETHIDYALARARYDINAGAFALSDEILGHFKDAERLRPLAANPKVLLGSLYFRREINAKKSGDVYAFNAALSNAREAYDAAVECYPLHPGLRLMAGDPQTIAGNRSASKNYLQAFEIDMRINDPNVYLAGMFIDPRPGVFARHGADADVLSAIERQLNETDAGKDPAVFAGLLVRRLTAQAFLLRQIEERGSTPQIDAEIAKAKIELEKTARDLLAQFKALPQRAHAALLLAVCIDELEPPAEPKEKHAGWKTKYDAALQTARALQAESVKSGSPGTAPPIFKALTSPSESAWRK